MQTRLLGLLLVGLISSCAYGEIRVNLAEQTSGTYLQKNEANSIDGTTLYTTVASLLTVDPIMAIDSELSNKIARVVKAQPFNSAEAVLAVAVAGLSPDTKMAGEEDVLKGLANARHLKGVEVTQLDTTSLPGCGEACLEQLLMTAGPSLGLNASYAEGYGPLRGVWTVQLNGKLVSYDLAEVNDRLLALEVASFWAAVQDTASEKERRVSQDPSGYNHPQILVKAFISPLMLKQTYGSSSPQFKGAEAIFSQMLAQAQTTLQASFNGRFVSVVVSLDNVEKSQEDALMALTTPLDSLVTSKRRLLASEGDSDYLESFIAWVAMWGTFLLLLFFGLSGSHCLRSMKFKQDSLLYGKNKSD